ncbi:hypothetical protein FF36_06420 [Frankia torreyi]|uniref:Uncharacterized protein n=1 Tax=Frankia torreyi TaxID=1856 RepID=A0A0D8B5E1_9ACTN|nr:MULTISPECIES: hypothetical protein [Frankia]KJE19310.1 hypothetical protein FF36_06420 [Frankia torreyi]KQC37682.1 hypothetical protein UK82_13625 [Frankia sp. ACN1ag]
MGDRTDRRAELWLGRNENPIGPAPGTVNRIRAPAGELHHYSSGLTEAVTGVAAEEWFDRVGPEVVAREDPDPTGDSTALTLGFLVPPNLR